MKKITYFLRPSTLNVSIERVFTTISQSLPDSYSYENIVIPSYMNEAKGIKETMLAFLKIRRFCKLKAGEINHITGDIHYCTLFLPSQNTILTIHDLVSLKTLKGIKRTFVWLFWYYLPLKRAKNITCISQYTADQLVDLFPWVKDRITVIENPVGPEFKYKPKLFNVNRPSILHIGTRENKNLGRVAKSLRGLDCHLRIIGKLSESQLQILNQCKIDYTNEEFVTDSQMIKEYEYCDIVSFPSMYEGFGMPIIEGQMVGRAVLTSNISPMKEISGGGACLVDPYNIESIRKGFKMLIEDDAFRENIIENSKKNILNYLPEIAAIKYCSIYNKIRQQQLLK